MQRVQARYASGLRLRLRAWRAFRQGSTRPGALQTKKWRSTAVRRSDSAEPLPRTRCHRRRGNIAMHAAACVARRGKACTKAPHKMCSRPWARVRSSMRHAKGHLPGMLQGHAARVEPPPAKCPKRLPEMRAT